MGFSRKTTIVVWAGDGGWAGFDSNGSTTEVRRENDSVLIETGDASGEDLEILLTPSILPAVIEAARRAMDR